MNNYMENVVRNAFGRSGVVPGPMIMDMNGPDSMFAGAPSRNHSRNRSNAPTYQSEPRGYGGSGGVRWTQESRMTRTINGVTESVWSRTDSDVSLILLNEIHKVSF